MAAVNCENRNRACPVNLPKIKKIASFVLGEIGRPDSEVNILFVTDKAMRELNRKYLRGDRATDVLAFGHASRGLASRRSRGSFMGDIAVSTDTAARNAKKYGNSFREETALCVIHALLHLAGYDDKKAADRFRMRKKENALFEKIRRTV